MYPAICRNDRAGRCGYGCCLVPFKNDTRAMAFRPLLVGRLLLVSFMTVTELDRWTQFYRWGESRRQRMEAHLKQYIVYHSDRDLCRGWAEVINEARRKGRPISVADAWIAATSLHTGYPLVTHNRKHYEGIESLRLLPD
jgi:tRNA(fMet)-specific endonuclease VapC